MTPLASRWHGLSGPAGKGIRTAAELSDAEPRRKRTSAAAERLTAEGAAELRAKTTRRADARADGDGWRPPGRASLDAPANAHVEQMPRVRLTRARLVRLDHLHRLDRRVPVLRPAEAGGLSHTWNRLRQGNVWWLALAFVLEALSFLGYVALFRARVRRAAPPDQLAGELRDHDGGPRGDALVRRRRRRRDRPDRLGAAAVGDGAPASSRCRMVAFMALLYGVYMLALVIDGFGLYLGLCPGPAPFAITVVPAIFGAA